MTQSKKIALIGFAIFAFAIFYRVYIADYLAYRKVKSERTEEACDEYTRRFYDGFYLEDVRFIEIDITRSFAKVRQFKQNYPESKYTVWVNEINNALWETEYNKYLSQISELSDPEAVEYFKTLLNYLRKNDIYQISVGFMGDMKLKDYEMYSETVRDLYENLFMSLNMPSVNQHMVPLGSNYSQGEIDSLELMVTSALQKSFNKVFSEGFLEVTKSENQIVNGQVEEPLMVVKYNIKNQEIDDYNENIPEIWVYNENEQFKAYLLAIAIDFEFASRLPEDSGIGYSFSNNSYPTEDIEFYGALQNGYAIMTQDVFRKFASSIAADFSLPTDTLADYNFEFNLSAN